MLKSQFGKENHKPQRCDLCESQTELLHALEIYGRTLDGWEWFIACTNPDCRAFVETKVGTNVAAKSMATPRTRRARRDAHRVFDQLWYPDKDKRKLAYAWLRQVTGLNEKECHIAKFNFFQCQEVIRLVREHNPEL